MEASRESVANGWQESLPAIALVRGGSERVDANERRSFDAERDFGAIDAIDTRIAAGSAAGGVDAAAGEKAHFHEAAAEVVGEVEFAQERMLAAPEVGEIGRDRRGRVLFLAEELVETQLHSRISIWR